MRRGLHPIVMIGLVIAAALPAQHLLLIGADLNGARVLYLPVLGFSLFWGFLVEGCPPGTGRALLTTGLVLFQLIALEHNLSIWREVAFLAQRTCEATGEELRRDPRNIVVYGLPATRKGIYFLQNGFRQCIAMTTGQDMNRVSILEDDPRVPQNARFFSWNDRSARLDEKAVLPARYPPARSNTHLHP